ncbi:MAG: hypothetical protein R2799_04710 [Crocinitomicaceae bacterium]
MFIEFNLNQIQAVLNNLQVHTTPLWGEMSPKEMVVHMQDTLKISNHKTSLEILTPEDKLPLYIGFLNSKKEMPKGYKVDYFQKPDLSQSQLDDLINAHNLELEEFFTHHHESNYSAIHPIYGDLNYDLWCKLHQKHYTHHFKQFGLIQ